MSCCRGSLSPPSFNCIFRVRTLSYCAMRLHARRLARCISGRPPRPAVARSPRSESRRNERRENIFGSGNVDRRDADAAVADNGGCRCALHTHRSPRIRFLRSAGPPLFLFICIVYLHATAAEWDREGEHYDIRRQRCDRRRLLFNDNKLLVDKTDDNVPLVQVLVLNMLLESFRLSRSACDSRRTFLPSPERKK